MASYSTGDTPDDFHWHDHKTAADVHHDVPAPAPSNEPQSLFSRAKQVLAPFLSDSEGANPKPRLQLSPKIVKDFEYLGITILNRPTDIDDRLYVFQDGIKLMATRGPGWRFAGSFNATAVALLHNDKRRPVSADLVVPATQSSSVSHPFIRRVGAPLGFTPLPDPDLVFRSLMQKSHVVDHPNGISGMAFAIVAILSLSLLRINEKKADRNETSPYLDLSPLYGVNEAEMDLVREKDGRGMLSPDCFYEDRVLLLPPVVSALLILWNRNHNFIARHLLLNNEGKKWVDPTEYPPSPDGVLTARFQTQDDEIFATARLINCVQFKNIISEDLLKLLMGLPSVGKSANLDILMDHQHSEKGKGHISSMEFSLLYNCTSIMAPEDVKAIEERMEAEFLVPFDQLSTEDVKTMLSGKGNRRNLTKRQRDEAGLRRGIDSRFRDEDLTRVLQDATESSAGAPGARGISSCFRIAEIVIIERARQWGVCSFNDFRKFLGLKVLKSFKEWNSDSDVAKAAEELYGNINNLELYPGLQAEQTMPGSGLGLGYTMTYGLLVDLVTMIRSDGRFTTEFTPAKLTQWGYNDCKFALNNGAFGSSLPRLLQRNLPRNYPYNSTYSLFPLTCPTKARSLLQSSSDLKDYDFEKPKDRPVKIIQSKGTISYVFNKPSVYQTIYGKDLQALTGGYGFFLGFDHEELHDKDLMMTMFALIPDKGTVSRYASYFGKTAAGLIRDKSTSNNGHRSVDIVRDVINATCTRWVCETLCAMSLGEDEVTKKHEQFAALYAFVFRNIDPETGWAVRKIALDAAHELAEEIERRIPVPTDSVVPSWGESLSGSLTDVYNFFARIYQELGPGKLVSEHVTVTFLDRMLKANKTFRLGKLAKYGHLRDLLNIPEGELDILKREEELQKRRVVANVLGLAVVTAVNYAQACAQAVDFYLDDAYKKEREEIVRLSSLLPEDARSQDANTKIMGYIREAQRIGQPLGLWRDVAADDTIPQGDGCPNIEVKKGDRIFVDFNTAHMNAADIRDPHRIDPDRKSPSIQGMGFHKCPGTGFVDETMPELFKAIFRLKNLRRDTGKAGRLERLVCHPVPIQSDPKVYLDPTGEISHFPRSLSLLYEDDGSEEGSPSKPRRLNWNIVPGAGHRIRELRRIVNRIMNIVVGCFLLYVLVYVLVIFIISPLRRVSIPSRPRRPPPTMADVKTEIIECPTPTTVFQPYDIHTILPGPDGHPLPLEYTLDHHKAHMLSVVDIDALDMQMAVYVDDELRGLTREFELDKTQNCGDDLRTCLLEGWSAGLVIVRPGNHTVRVEWVGKDYIPGTHDIDWGKERSRRLLWQREYCG